MILSRIEPKQPELAPKLDSLYLLLVDLYLKV
jgi:hypothetical protein